MVASIDIAIVTIFFIITFGIGIFDRKYVTLDDYWVNSRKTNKFVLVATILSSFIGAGAILANASITHSGAGIASFAIVASYFLYFFVFAKFFAPKIKQFGDRRRAYTLPDFFEARYGKRVRIAGAVINLTSWTLFLALQILALGIFVNVLFPVHSIIATIIGGLIIVGYTTIGGLRADIRSDVFQFFIMFSLLLIFLPILFLKSGGFAAIHAMPIEFLRGDLFAPWYVYVLAFFFLGAGTLTSPDLWQRAYAADSVKNVKWAMRVCGILVLLFLSMAVLFGLFGKILLPDIPSNNIIPSLLSAYLPAGFFGIVIAGFFAAIISSADTVLLITSMTIVHDLRRKKMSNKAALRRSRWATALIGSIAVALAIIISNIVHLTIEAVSFYVALLPAVVFGFYWKKATSAAAFWSIVVGFITITLFLFISPIQAFIPGIIASFLTFFIVQFFQKKSRINKN